MVIKSILLSLLFYVLFFLILTKLVVRTEAEIVSLANRKSKAAELLLVSGFFDDAYYNGVKS